MMFWKLRHNPRLRMPPAGPPLRLDADPDEVVLSFRDMGSPHRTFTVDATTRLNVFGDIRRLSIVGLDDDSELALVIATDVLHSLPVGATVRYVTARPNQIIARDYYRDAFEPVAHGEGSALYRKIAPCLTERTPSLDDWSFCIPVGPGDATILNCLVERILKFEGIRSEILLGGQPGPNFKFRDRVTIVPERRNDKADSTAAINITEKKNILVEHANHENVCLLHDRVILPDNFPSVIWNCGQLYAVMTLQSLYFDDYNNSSPVRYSDFCTIRRPSALRLVGSISRDGRSVSAFGSTAIGFVIENTEFNFQHALRTSEISYLTGSLYICKRDLWRRYPQDENILWGECEDVEHGLRMAAAGVPHSINPFGLTQSATFRSAIILHGIAPTVGADGRPTPMRMPLSVFPWSRRKPYLRKSSSDAANSLAAVLSKHSAAEDPPPSALPVRTSAAWVRQAISLSKHIRVPFSEDAVRRFVDDWTAAAHLDSLTYDAREGFVREIMLKGRSGLDWFIRDHYNFVSLMTLRPSVDVFTETAGQALLRRSMSARAGSMVSALRLWRRRFRHVYVRGGPIAYYRAIMACTPFRGVE